MTSTHGPADPAETRGLVELSYSDGTQASAGLANVNGVLRTIGVHAGTVPLPEAASPILGASRARAIDSEESARLLSLFSLDRAELLDEIAQAGRAPAAPRGGSLSTSEADVPPYPKVYDMQALTPEVRAQLQAKFGRLHVNSSDGGVGIDEVMTLVSGGPWTWFFLLDDDVIGRLTLGFVDLDGPGWRISYPGLTPHGAFLNSESGLVVAHAHGPEEFVMRYDLPGIRGSKMLGTNAWIDMSGETPRLRDEV